RPLPATLSVKASPYRRWHSSRSPRGSPAKRTSCHQAGAVGPGGSADFGGGVGAIVWDIGRTPSRAGQARPLGDQRLGGPVGAGRVTDLGVDDHIITTTGLATEY